MASARGRGCAPRRRRRHADRPDLYAATQVADVPAALATAGDWLRETQNARARSPSAIASCTAARDYDRPVADRRRGAAELERYVSLAPLHQPNNLAPIRSLLARCPELPQVACFDTAFHRGHGAVADHYAIPERLYAEGVRRYGFHGLSYEYIAERLREVAPEIASGRVIVAHLGSGASMCALADGRSVESTMGFTALDGLPMGTRPGPDRSRRRALPDHREGHERQGESRICSIAKAASRACPASATTCASSRRAPIRAPKLALDYFVYRVGLHAGMLAAALGGH